MHYIFSVSSYWRLVLNPEILLLYQFKVKIFLLQFWENTQFFCLFAIKQISLRVTWASSGATTDCAFPPASTVMVTKTAPTSRTRGTAPPFRALTISSCAPKAWPAHPRVEPGEIFIFCRKFLLTQIIFHAVV